MANIFVEDRKPFAADCLESSMFVEVLDSLKGNLIRIRSIWTDCEAPGQSEAFRL